MLIVFDAWVWFVSFILVSEVRSCSIEMSFKIANNCFRIIKNFIEKGCR